MTQIWYHFHRVWIYVALLIPVAFLLAALLTWLRPSHSWRRSAAEVGMVFGTLPWVWMILTPMKLEPGATTVYLIPLSDLIHRFDLIQIVGNLLVFFAFGAFGPIRFPALTLPRLALIGAVASLVLESMQFFFVGGRVFSVDDVWLNALGCVLGGLISRRWQATTSA